LFLLDKSPKDDEDIIPNFMRRKKDMEEWVEVKRRSGSINKKVIN